MPPARRFWPAASRTEKSDCCIIWDPLRRLRYFATPCGNTDKEWRSSLWSKRLDTLPRKRMHRATFVAAGVYNLAWGVFANVDPQWMFRFAGMPLLNHPQIFALPGYGHRAVRSGVLGGSSQSRAQLGDSRRGLCRQGTWAAGRVAVDLEWYLAARFRGNVLDERRDLVGTICPVPVRRVAGIQGRLETRIIGPSLSALAKNFSQVCSYWTFAN